MRQDKDYFHFFEANSTNFKNYICTIGGKKLGCKLKLSDHLAEVHWVFFLQQICTEDQTRVLLHAGSVMKSLFTTNYAFLGIMASRTESSQTSPWYMKWVSCVSIQLLVWVYFLLYVPLKKIYLSRGSFRLLHLIDSGPKQHVRRLLNSVVSCML